MMRSTGLLLGLVLVLHLTSSYTVLDPVPEENDNYKGMEDKRAGPWSEWNRLRGLSKRPWRPFRPEEKPYVIIHEFPDNDINNLEKKIYMVRALKRMDFRPTKRSSADLDLDDLPNLTNKLLGSRGGDICEREIQRTNFVKVGELSAW